MPGRLQRDFRFGNLAEHLGVLLLKGIAAVADVPRPEDVGLDALATLLRPDDDDNLYAEDTFVVQLKSASPKPIKYQGHALEWLIGQSQPMFIGLVSLADCEISLYPTIYVNHAVLALHAEWVEVRFGISDTEPFFRGQKWAPWKGEPDRGATVWLGEPLLRWSLSDLVDRDWVARTYETLKRFIGVARRELELLSFGQSSVLDWSTNDANSITSQSGLKKGSPDDLESLADRCAPCLRAMMLCAFSMPDESAISIMIPLISLAASLRDVGIEIDRDNMFGDMFFALQNLPHLDDA